MQIIVAAAHGPIRFTELERSIEGISRRMLTLTLRNLERDGLLTRTVHPMVPPKVEYELTPVAEELHATLLSLTDWAERHRVTIAESRAASTPSTARSCWTRRPRHAGWARGRRPDPRPARRSTRGSATNLHSLRSSSPPTAVNSAARVPSAFRMVCPIR